MAHIWPYMDHIWLEILAPPQASSTQSGEGQLFSGLDGNPWESRSDLVKTTFQSKMLSLPLKDRTLISYALNWLRMAFGQSGRGHQDDRAKNRSKNSQRLDHKIGQLEEKRQNIMKKVRKKHKQRQKITKKSKKTKKNMKKPQTSGKKAPAGNKRPRRATKTLKNQKSLEKNKKKQIY